MSKSNKNNNRYLNSSDVEQELDSFGRILITVGFSIIGFLIGILIRLFSYPTALNSAASIVWQYLPWGLIGAALFGIFSYKYHRLAAILLLFMPGCEISS